MRTQTFDGDVKWSETDASGRIHNTAVFRWAESAEHALCYDLASDLATERLPRRRVEATYHRPLVFRDPYRVTLSVVRLGRTSITYAWTVTSRGELCVEGSHVAVHIDDDGRPTPWPEQFQAAIAEQMTPHPTDSSDALVTHPPEGHHA
ncbi:acyl-CoA thioesterase [Georgenia yuyongxinii]|uniref:Acyl-CoA thioesterase n=1 Tax=Georgenia yuyongxinii TaxID=2589797 RepID=A0A552WU40_9MICO|nr:thioesterase family protein [Georgenia yuyongxinii]TRW46267.1 acyl-CoA thioesterase [Georgenia yuyongxinii]